MSFAHNSYTGGYSGAPGRSTCASSCHGSSGGSIIVSGFPASYQPLQTYRIVVKRNGGSMIVNFNATTRVGNTSTIAGTFATATNTTLYNGTDGGVYASPHLIDSAVFQWTAPAAGTGIVNFYVASFQGTTSNKNGQNAKVTLSASEILTSVKDESIPTAISLDQNFPNPFNPTTSIKFQIPNHTSQSRPNLGFGDGNLEFVALKVYDLLGHEVATLVHEQKEAGTHFVSFDGSKLASGIYIYQLTDGTFVLTKKMILAK
ncbi:MAG: T9SS type A sorting domain-containing protein [Ignavibacteriae bacterium]|nr:T9SS type A sorting domain-containing protein [Ignavibacteriota bacterium]